MEKNSFRVIAVRVLPNCELGIMRALWPDVTYFLCNDYEDEYTEKGEWRGIIKSKDIKDSLPKDFFSLPKRVPNKKKNKPTPTVSVSAIVGKNGDGKSSLIELMLRVINNFAFVYGFKQDQDSLTYAQGVAATVFYEIDGVLYSITCDGEKVTTSFADRIEDKLQLKKHQQELFYTVVANYSIYAYNALNLNRENEEDESCWINSVFHKNDSYQTPLVLNPMRTDGNFDVNREENLCRQRLMALYTDLGDEEDARLINETKTASGFAFNLEDCSKLETMTLKRYFQSTWKSTSLYSAAGDLESFVKNVLSTKSNQRKKAARLEYDWQISFWMQYGELWDKYKTLFELAEKVEREVYKENNANYGDEDTDLKRYLNVAKLAFGSILEKDEKKKTLKSIATVSSLCGNITGLQLQRLVLIIDVCELWSRHHWFEGKVKFSTAIKQYVEGTSNSVERCHALLYVVYKTISIFSQYQTFIQLLDVNLRYFYLFDRRYDNTPDGIGYYDRLPLCFNQLFVDETKQKLVKKYDTLKLRQTVNFLVYRSFKLNRTQDWFTEKDFGYSQYVKFERLQGFINDAKKKCDEETIALLPPPIFVGDILIREGEDRSGNPRFRMADLSSGELQMLNSISTYLYHLRNLNYHVGNADLIEYSYVNLILEEVELYFHPEYQRQYVYRMLKQIEQMRLDNIKAINIILVTHSPFILTDVPKNNVLFLQKGEPVHVMQENTFGANIHALLQNGFFLDGTPMGEFAKDKINMMFERLHYGEYNEELFEEIKLVSEPLLKTQLYQLYSLNKLVHQNPQYDELMERIKKLEDRLYD
jgi:predicted ATPase